MNKGLINEDLKLSVLFFKSDKFYYYKFNDKMNLINSITINKLKEKLNVPFKVQFNGMSKEQIAKVITCLLDSTMDVSIKKMPDEVDNILKYEATFIHKKRYVEVYKVPNVSTLYGRRNDSNPFLYIDINSKKVLIEVTKDYAKNKIGDCYFLYCDLDMVEKEFFESQYDELECDYIYRFENDLSDKKSKQKRMRNKF